MSGDKKQCWEAYRAVLCLNHLMDVLEEYPDFVKIRPCEQVAIDCIEALSAHVSNHCKRDHIDQGLADKDIIEILAKSLAKAVETLGMV